MGGGEEGGVDERGERKVERMWEREKNGENEGGRKRDAVMKVV